MNKFEEFSAWDDVDAYNTGHISYSLNVSYFTRKLSTEKTGKFNILHVAAVVTKHIACSSCSNKTYCM